MSKHLEKSTHVKTTHAKKEKTQKERKAYAARTGEAYPLNWISGVLLLLSIVIIIVAAFLPFETKGLIGLGIYAGAFIPAAVFPVKEAVYSILEKKYFSAEITVITACVAAFAIGSFCAGAVIMAAFFGEKLLIAYARGREDKLYAGMDEILPCEATIELDGESVSVNPEDIAPGDTVLVGVNEVIPVDGKVIEGSSAVSGVLYNGKSGSKAVDKGAKVCSGCVNLTNPIKLRAGETYDASTAAVINSMMVNAHLEDTEQERFLNKISRYISPIMTLLAVLIAVIPGALGGEWREWIGRAVIILAISGIEPMLVSVPLAYLGAIASGGKKGIIYVGTRFVETLAKAKTFVFNKTGTITQAKYVILDIVPKGGLTEQELLIIAAAAEQASDHPIAQALRAACGMDKISEDESLKFEEIVGYGISTFVRGKQVYVGSPGLLERHGIHTDIPKRGNFSLHVAVDGKYMGYIILSDKIKECSINSIEALRAQGVGNLVMLTGDVHSVARPIAASLGFDMMKSEQDEDAKISSVEYLKSTKPDRTALAFVCDGSSDGEVLKEADVGVALEALGDEGALEVGDVLILNDDISALPEAVRIALLSYNVAGLNMLVTAGIKIIILALGIGGVLPIIPAVLLNFAAGGFVLLNAFRTFYEKGAKG